jgi:hypothetical protein
MWSVGLGPSALRLKHFLVNHGIMMVTHSYCSPELTPANFSYSVKWKPPSQEEDFGHWGHQECTCSMKCSFFGHLQWLESSRKVLIVFFFLCFNFVHITPYNIVLQLCFPCICVLSIVNLFSDLVYILKHSSLWVWSLWECCWHVP